jgi:RNA polymerase sigma factor (sigma-70 family)
MKTVNELIQLYKDTTKDIYYNKLLEQYKPLINKTINRNKYKYSHWQDLEQEMALILLEAIKSYDLESTFTFYNHLRFRLLNYVRDFTVNEDKYKSIDEFSQCRITRAKNTGVKDIIYDCIKSNKLHFSPETIGVLRAYYIEGYTHVEIAKVYKLSRGTIMNIREKAIKEIIALYQKPIN